MNRGMAAGAPAGASVYKCCVRDIANEKVSAHGVKLGVAFQAQIVVALDQHLVRDGTVGGMADGATFP